MNKIIFATSIIVSASLGYWAGKNSHTPGALTSTSIIAERDVVTAQAAIKPSPEVVEKHRDSVTIVKQQLPSHSEQSNSSQPMQQQIDAVRAQYEFEQRSEKFTNWLTKNQKEKPWFDLGVEMGGRFEAEETDYSWAASEEGYFQTLFTQDPALAGIALKATSCKSTQCRITVSVMDQDHANNTAMTISNVIGSHKSTQIIIDNNVEQGEATFYVSRNEKGFELE